MRLSILRTASRSAAVACPTPVLPHSDHLTACFSRVMAAWTRAVSSAETLQGGQASAGAAPSEAATPVMASHSTQADNALAANATPAQRDSLLFEHDPSIDAVADAHFLSRADEARYASLVDELEGLRRGMAEQPEPPSGTEDPEFLTQEELASLEKLLDEQITELEQAERQGNLHRQTPADIRQALMAAQRATIQEQQVEEDRLRAEGKEPEPFPFDLSHRPRTVNFAGVDVPGWRMFEEDPDVQATYWELDQTGGAVHENERNALLCQDSKEMMYDWHKNWGWSISDLAIYFRIRQQRVMAIIALKEIEHAEVDRTGEKLDRSIQYALEGGPGRKDDGSDGFDGLWDCDEAVGVGERHVKLMPRAPHYEYGNELEGPEGQRDKNLPRDPDETREKLEKEEDVMMIKEFQDRLDFNMGRTGKDIQRTSRHKVGPTRPEGGYSLVVRTLDKKDAGGKHNAYVAQPGGEQRALTDSEALYLERQRPKPRRRLD